ncbi:MAG: urate hydroxylase PuuD [Bdellovibrionales bacterium]
MSTLLEKLYLAVNAGLVLVILLSFGYHADEAEVNALQFTSGIMTWLHVISGIMWIGLLWYFNFVQIPTMPEIPADLKPGVSKYIAPRALFYFRWAALATVVTGLTLAWMKGYVHEALALEAPAQTIGTGMWLALVMAFNVWFIIWPNQKKALGMVVVSDAEKAAAARAAMLASRLNTLLSFPMLYCMVSQGVLG